uniref:Uncharacterized protein n=1 Tax=Arundo donax TaxID=35708 RepID=A0A0A8Y3B0_ARUDO
MVVGRRRAHVLCLSVGWALSHFRLGQRTLYAFAAKFTFLIQMPKPTALLPH